MNLIDLIEICQIKTDSDNLYCLWDNIVLDARLNKQTLFECILYECGNMTPYFNTVNSFRLMSDRFFIKWNHEITKLIDTLFFEYNPIWNKDVTDREAWQRDVTENEGVAREREQETERETTENEEIENKTSAFNSSEYENADKTYRDTHENSTEEVGETETTDRDRAEIEKYGRTFVSQGNQGVTTTQAMIREERELMEFNIYDWIVDKYQNEMFLCVF